MIQTEWVHMLKTISVNCIPAIKYQTIHVSYFSTPVFTYMISPLYSLKYYAPSVAKLNLTRYTLRSVISVCYVHTKIIDHIA